MNPSNPEAPTTIACAVEYGGDVYAVKFPQRRVVRVVATDVVGTVVGIMQLVDGPTHYLVRQPDATRGGQWYAEELLENF